MFEHDPWFEETHSANIYSDDCTDIFLIILTYFYLNNIFKAGLLLVTEYLF